MKHKVTAGTIGVHFSSLYLRFLLKGLDDENLERLKTVIASADSLLWVSQEDRTAHRNPRKARFEVLRVQCKANRMSSDS